MNYMDIPPSEIPFSSDDLVKLLGMVEEDEITPEQGEMVLREMAEEPDDPEEKVEELGFKGLDEELESIVEEVLEEEEEAVEDFRNGKDEALNYLAGQVMQATKGRGDAREVMDILRETLGE